MEAVEPDLLETARALNTFLGPGQVTELRIFLKSGGVQSGYFNNVPLAASAVRNLDAEGIYYMPNPISPGLFARAANRIRDKWTSKTTTSDNDIQARRWLLVDVDPVRPAGISSTDDEHVAALSLVAEVRSAMVGAGWPAPAILDSGNGAHAMWQVDLPNDSDSTSLMEKVLAGLGEIFDSRWVKIDRKTFNAARIWKLPGTWARKGDSLPERPHRIARVLEVPERFLPVSVDQLREIAVAAPQPDPGTKNGSHGQGGAEAEAWLRQWLREHNVPVISEEPKVIAGGRLLWRLQACPWNADHGHDSWVMLLPSGAKQARCFHSGCAGKAWKDFRLLFEPGAYEKKERGKKKESPQGENEKSKEEEVPTDTASIARWILENGERFARDGGGKLYVYRGGRYRDSGETRAHKRTKEYFVENRIPEKWSFYRAREVTQFIAADSEELWDTPPIDVVNVKNGLLVLNGLIEQGDPDAIRLRDHDPEHLSPVQLPVHYHPGATCPAWEKFIDEVFPVDSRTLPWEILAWLMIPFTGIQKSVLFMGEGGTGKSTFLSGVKNFLGRKNVSAKSLHRLEENRFSVGGLVGKLANICADLPSQDLKGTSIFKEITGGDEVTGEHKFKSEFDFSPFSRLLFSANRPPRSPDATEAFFDRWLVVPFRNKFRDVKGKEISRHKLDASLKDPRELSGVLNRALEALPRVVEHGIHVSESMRAAHEEFREMTDPVLVWLNVNVLQSSGLVVSKQVLLSEFNAYAAAKGIPGETGKSFGAAVRRWHPMAKEAQRTINGRIVWCWIGLGLKKPVNEDPGDSRDSRDSRADPHLYSSSSSISSPELSTRQRCDDASESRELSEGDTVSREPGEDP